MPYFFIHTLSTCTREQYIVVCAWNCFAVYLTAYRSQKMLTVPFFFSQGVSAVEAFYELLSQPSLNILHPGDYKPVAPVELCPILKTLYKILIKRFKFIISLDLHLLNSYPWNALDNHFLGNETVVNHPYFFRHVLQNTRLALNLKFRGMYCVQWSDGRNVASPQQSFKWAWHTQNSSSVEPRFLWGHQKISFHLHILGVQLSEFSVRFLAEPELFIWLSNLFAGQQINS